MKKILINEKIANAFSLLGSGYSSVEGTILMKEFLCKLYGLKNIANMDEVRYSISKKKVNPLTVKNPLEFLKSVGSMSFPPSQKILHLQIKRAWYVSKLY